jgi:uncharacterized protein
MKEDEKARLDRLRKQLNEIHTWPSLFMFKFIIPTDTAKITRLHEIFGEIAEYRERLSGKGNYTSVTIREMMLNADQIFDRYTEASKIEGIISL